MKPPPFDYHAPDSLPEALELLAQYGDDAKVLAGGQSLVPLLNLRLARPSHLIDINNVTELAQLDASNGVLHIGALVRQRTAERSAAVRQRNPLLSEALPMIGHPQIRNRGTMGGSLAHADPASELPAVALALGARMHARSKSAQRAIDADDFFVSYLTTALQPDELLVGTEWPAWPERTGWAYMEVSRRHGDFALVGVGVTLTVEASGSIADARLAYTGASAVPVRARQAEGALRGQPPAEATFAGAAEEASKALDPQSDVHASAAYRFHVAKVLTQRALARAAARARGGAA